MASRFVSKGINHLGPEIVSKYILECYDAHKLPIVSVGSGIGEIEHIVKTKNGNMEIICVDPDPTSFSEDRYVQTEPSYNYVSSLIKSNPGIVGNCIVLLNWCLPNDSTYDHDAIIELQPAAVVTVYEKFYGGNGAAGGQKFHTWLDSTQTGTNTSYSMVTTTTIEDPRGSDIRVSWIRQNSTEIPDVHLPQLVKRQMAYNPRDECAVM
ncbi:MAG: hypothetical protein AAB276_02060 [Pseudomonadota bacterium]